MLTDKGTGKYLPTRPRRKMELYYLIVFRTINCDKGHGAEESQHRFQRPKRMFASMTGSYQTSNLMLAAVTGVKL